eukprot:11649084-Prorocentrum_lima.AAC.1
MVGEHGSAVERTTSPHGHLLLDLCLRMGLSLPTTFSSHSSVGTHVHGDSVRKIDFILASALLLKA